VAENQTTPEREVTVYDDTVRDGLKAAAGTWVCTCHASAPCADCTRYAGKAVAAFLRAFDPAERFSPRLLADIAEEISDAR
jgi:hypothetical protein